MSRGSPHLHAQLPTMTTRTTWAGQRPSHHCHVFLCFVGKNGTWRHLSKSLHPGWLGGLCHGQAWGRPAGLGTGMGTVISLLEHKGFPIPKGTLQAPSSPPQMLVSPVTPTDTGWSTRAVLLLQ